MTNPILAARVTIIDTHTESHAMLNTKTRFLILYRDELASRYEWARNKAKLDRFMDSVANTVLHGHNTWSIVSADAAQVAWLANGGKGKVSLAKLRALPA